MQGLPATGLYTLRNIFRNKQRLALTLIVLIISGATFITVTGTRQALLIALNQVADYRLQDFEVRFAYPERIEKVEQIALTHAEVTAVESRLELREVPVKLLTDSGTGTTMDNIVVSGLAAETAFLIPTMLEGRWLEPTDENGMVVNAEFRAAMEGVQVGDWVEMEVNGRSSTWQIVGVALGQIVAGGEILSPMAYVPQQQLAKVAGLFGSTDKILVQVNSGIDPAQFSTELNQTFVNQGVDIRAVTLKSTVQMVVELPFQIVLSLVFVMIMLFALAGGLGLMGLMSLSVLERTHELGVLRATGASPREILTIILLEGMFIGGLSWFGTSIVALPMGRLLNNLVGELLLQVPLSTTFPWAGMFYWLLIVIPLSALASFIPAWRASQATVSDALNYE